MSCVNTNRQETTALHGSEREWIVPIDRPAASQAGVRGILPRPRKHTPAVHFTSVLVPIAIFDIIFSLHSVIAAVNVAEHVPVMLLAIVIAVIVRGDARAQASGGGV